MQEYRGGDVILRRSEDRPTVELRGPNAKAAKFGDHFCARCNNERSQPFDLAYDRFIDWFLSNENQIEDTGLLPLEEIFDDWREGQNLVNCYYAKHAGCRIADVGYRVPDSLREYLDGVGEPVGFAFNFELSGFLAGLSAILKENPTLDGTSGNLGLGGVHGQLTHEGGPAVELVSWSSYHALQVYWQWSTDYPRSWTNLLGPVAELPRIEPELRDQLLRNSRNPDLQPGTPDPTSKEQV